MTLEVLILILALLGAVDAGYLLRKKTRGEKLVCPVGGEGCNTVLHSKYGSVLGVPNEAFGLAFYVLATAVILAMFVGIESAAGVSLLLVLQGAALLAVAASAVLFGLQAFVIKAWCEYCLVSIGINAAIALLIFLW